MTTILFDAAKVKHTTTRRFGRGILPTLPVYRADHTAADEAWLIEDNARRAAEDRHFDRLAGESAALSRMESGLCC